ncbi:MAG: histidine kinase [Firmicutes bacterium]|nr:histidine kinase [Bacillota bacterium]
MSRRMRKFFKASLYIGYTLMMCIFILTIILDVLSIRGSEPIPTGADITEHKLVGVYSFDGSTWTDLSEGIVPGAEHVLIRAHFDSPQKDNYDLYLSVNNLGLKASINGKEIAAFGQSGTYPSFSEGPGIAMLPLTDVNVGKDDELELVIDNPYSTYRPYAIGEQLDKLFFSGRVDSVYELFSRMDWIVTLLGLTIFIVGLYTFVTRLIYSKNGYIESRKEKTVLTAFSFFAWVSGYYVFAEGLYTVLPIIIKIPVLCNVIDIIAPFFLVSASALYFYSTLVAERSRKIMWTVTMLINVAVLVCLAMQLLGICDLYRMQIIPAIGGAAAMATGAPLLVYEYKKNDNRSALFVALSFIPICVGEIATAIAMILNDSVIDSVSNRQILCVSVIITSWLQLLRLANLSKYQAYQTTQLASAQAELNDTRISMMMSQIQPHFLYNALNTIQYQCQVDGNKAASTVESFAKFLRGNMDSLSQTEPIPLSKEIQHLENYLAIEKLRFPDIQYVYKLKASDFDIPPLTIQPLVENSIRYGVRSLEDGGTITIESWEDEHNYYARVSDNGVGFDINQKKNDGRSHVGMQNIKTRVKSMCGGHVEIESKIGVGTRSTIVIPKGGKKR